MREADEVQVAEPAATMPLLALLLGLETHVLMGVVDAVLDGAQWSRAGDDRPPSLRRWALCDCEGALLTIFDSGEIDAFPLLSPLRDDAAAYRMETRELLHLIPPRPDDVPALWWSHGWDARFPWNRHPDRRTAACLAVCHKHADHPELGPLCRELTTRLTSKENTE